MGETGIGKTFLIELLAMLINVEFQVLNVHAGITRLEIIDFVNICKTKCKNDD
jgi:MoxR-like ATPase